MSQALGERHAAILRAVVHEYVRSGEPVGSRHLVARARLDVSPATVRNDMARLEEMGYLAQPHTSAGRIPTDLGYRFVVDEMTQPRELAVGQRRRLEEELGEQGSVDDLIRRAGDAVSRFTHHAAAILARLARSGRLRRLEMIGMSERTAMAVAIADNGRVEQRVIPLGRPLEAAELDALAEDVNGRLGGTLLEDALRTVRDESARATEVRRALLEGVADAFQALLGSDDHVFVGGVSNLTGEETFERESLHRLTEALEEQTTVLGLLATAFDRPPVPLGGVSVRIGSELAAEDLRQCSLVVASFGPSGDAAGSIGVIGPTRMDYERAIATASAVARLLEAALGTPDDA